MGIYNKSKVDEIERLKRKYCSLNGQFGQFFYWDKSKNGTFHTPVGTSLNFRFPDMIIEIPVQEKSGKKLIELKHDGILKFFDSEPKIINQGGVRYIELDEWIPTGYLKKFFGFLQGNLKRMDQYEDIEDQTLSIFRIKKGEKFPIKTLPEIEAYKKLLYEHIQKQADQVISINKEIAAVLQVYVHEVLISTHHNGKPAINSIIHMTHENEKKKIYKKIKSFFNEIVLTGWKFDAVNDENLECFKKGKSFVSEELIDSTIRGLNSCLSNRDPYLEEGAKLAVNYQVIEELLLSAGKNGFGYEPNPTIYGVHQENEEWVAEAWKNERGKVNSNNKADINVRELYNKKFSLKISLRQIQRFTGR